MSFSLATGIKRGQSDDRRVSACTGILCQVHPEAILQRLGFPDDGNIRIGSHETAFWFGVEGPADIIVDVYPVSGFRDDFIEDNIRVSAADLRKSRICAVTVRAIEFHRFHGGIFPVLVVDEGVSHTLEGKLPSTQQGPTQAVDNSLPCNLQIERSPPGWWAFLLR